MNGQEEDGVGVCDLYTVEIGKHYLAGIPTTPTPASPELVAKHLPAAGPADGVQGYPLGEYCPGGILGI